MFIVSDVVWVIGVVVWVIGVVVSVVFVVVVVFSLFSLLQLFAIEISDEYNSNFEFSIIFWHIFFGHELSNKYISKRRF